MDETDDWLPGWCLGAFGVGPVEVLFERRSVSTVVGVRLADGREVVVKAREDDGRAPACVEAQARLAEGGFPCPRPLTSVTAVGGLAVHAEAYLPGGEVLEGDTPAVAERCAEVYARVMGGLAGVDVDPPLPNPRWVRWDHAGAGPWPPVDFLDSGDQSLVPTHVLDTATRARRRLLATRLPRVLGHADFEAQNLRWRGDRVHVVHDWDSLAWQPEAALVGAAGGMFASTSPPTLAPIAATEAFLTTYESTRDRRFTQEETEIAWAASLWPAAHNARWEALHRDPPTCTTALRDQAAERLRRANA